MRWQTRGLIGAAVGGVVGMLMPFGVGDWQFWLVLTATVFGAMAWLKLAEGK